MAGKKKRFSKLQWFEAVQAGDLKRVRAFIKEGINVDLHSDDFRGATALMRAGLTGGIELMEILIKAGADVNGKDNLGSTTLDYAAGAGNVDAIKLLLARGARMKNEDGRESALNAAVQAEKAEAALVLLQAGADPNVKKGPSVLHEAAKTGLVKVVDYLLKKGADVNAVNSSGLTPLAMAATGDQLEVATLLLASGADVKLGDNNALICASSGASLELCGKLVRAGAEANARNKDGYSALMAAVDWGRMDLVRLFLEAGTQVTAKTISEAQKHGSAKGGKECVELLKAFNATGKLPATKAPEPKQKYPEAVVRLKAITKSDPVIPKEILKGGYFFKVKGEAQAKKLVRQHREAFRKKGFYLFASGIGVGLFPGTDKCAVVAAMQTCGVDGPSNEELIEWLRGLDKKQSFELVLIEQDALELEFRNPVKNPEALVKRMIELCSDLVSSGDSAATWVRKLKSTGTFYLRWG